MAGWITPHYLILHDFVIVFKLSSTLSSIFLLQNEKFCRKIIDFKLCKLPKFSLDQSHYWLLLSLPLCQTNKTIPCVCWKSAIILVSFHVKDYQNAKIANSWRKRINSTFQIEEKNVLFLCLKSLCFKLRSLGYSHSGFSIFKARFCFYSSFC